MELPEDPGSVNEYALLCHEMYLGFCKAGFDHAAALYLVAAHGDTSFRPPSGNENEE